MRHVMIDLETLGTRAGCSIISIGAVEFDPQAGTLGDEYYAVISRYSCNKRGLFEDADTIDWWSRQSPEAREALDLASDWRTSMTLPDALVKFNEYLFRLAPPRDLRLYGNGADFDNPILGGAYAAAGMDFPVTYGGRCHRTLKNLHELFGEDFRAPSYERSGTYHNALDDAKTQAQHLIAIVDKVRNTGAVSETA